MTSVINIKKDNLKKLGYRDLLHWLEDSKHVYIGRNMSFYVKGSDKSKWCNPYPVKKHGLEESLRLYKNYISTQNYDYGELSGKVLGCWCKPGGCHGDILCELANAGSKKDSKQKRKATPDKETDRKSSKTEETVAINTIPRPVLGKRTSKTKVIILE